jgi:WD repeat-containing protein 1 (actin-interacting protein 1)
MPSVLALGGDEFMTKFYKGPPYKFIKSSKNHGTYMNALKFDPSGKFLASCSSDKKIVIYDR